jgi:hypothetical protein
MTDSGENEGSQHPCCGRIRRYRSKITTSASPNPLSQTFEKPQTKVETSTYVVPHISATGTPECLDSKHLSLLHPRGLIILHERNALVPVDTVGFYVVACDVSDCLDRISLAVDDDFVAFHDLLDGGAKVGDASVDAGFL